MATLAVFLGSFSTESTILISVACHQCVAAIAGERPKFKSCVHETSRCVFGVQDDKCFVKSTISC